MRLGARAKGIEVARRAEKEAQSQSSPTIVFVCLSTIFEELHLFLLSPAGPPPVRSPYVSRAPFPADRQLTGGKSDRQCVKRGIWPASCSRYETLAWGKCASKLFADLPSFSRGLSSLRKKDMVFQKKKKNRPTKPRPRSPRRSARRSLRRRRRLAPM